VVFAVDGASPYYGFEKKFGSLQNLAERRFQEAARALAMIPHCSFSRLTRTEGSCFVDQHLFFEMDEAYHRLFAAVREFSPDLLVSHAFEGGHLDHDACHVLARQTARILGLPLWEFPLYWKAEQGDDVLQTFREQREGEFVLHASADELLRKMAMLAKYRTQQEITAMFPPEIERFRPAAKHAQLKASWSEYPFENRRKPWKADLFFQKISEFEAHCENRTVEARACSEMPVNA
jgi:LmbE family N-acetylglucosaminyl deacetylase